MCQLALSQTTPGHSLGVKPFQKSFPTSTQWPRLQLRCRSDHIMLFGLSIQESSWTCLIYYHRQHHWAFAVFNLRKKNLCSLLPFVLWHSQVTLQNSGWSYSMLASKENLWHVGPHAGLTGVHCLENGVALGTSNSKPCWYPAIIRTVARMMHSVTSACELAKEPLAPVAVQKMRAASWYGQIELVSGKTLRVEL